MRVHRGVLLAVAVAAAVACTPPPTPPQGPAAPKVSSFAAVGGPFVAPTMVPLAWKVSDSDSADLTCRIDSDDDGTWELTVPHCQKVGGAGSRLVTASVGSHTARLEVSDGTLTATATTVFVVAPEATSESFQIDLRPLDPLDPSVEATFDAAAARWEEAVVRGVTDAEITLAPHQCLDSEPGATLDVDDLVITVEVTPIDGAGGVLGMAGPCVISGTDDLSRAGIMQFDSADVADMLDDGTFEAVVTHEMGHVLGIGTLWNFGHSLLSGAGTSNPRYVGARGKAELSTLGGSTEEVPVENTGGAGTVDSHWRESVFSTELMTGWISLTSNPLSALSISSLGDLGYAVDRSAADPYALPGGAVMGRPPAGGVDTSAMARPPITVQ